MTHLFRWALLAFLLVPAGFFPAQAKDTDDRKLKWLTPDQEQAIIAALPPSPAPGSPEDQADLAGVLKAQAARTPAQAAQVLAEKPSSPKLFQPVLGPDFGPEHEPIIYGLMGDAERETGLIDHDMKDKYQRPRPFRAHQEVHPVYQENGLSYPSGHAAAAYACAVLLTQIYPDKKAALLQQAAEIAENRVIGGVHYPSDIVTGEKLGRAIAQALLANPSFQQSLAVAKEAALAPAGK
jgi:acid phosphatase (class A)